MPKLEAWGIMGALPDAPLPRGRDFAHLRFMSDIFASTRQGTHSVGRAHSIGFHLAALALACAPPLVALSVYTIFSFAHMEHEVNRNDILGTARAAAVMVD